MSPKSISSSEIDASSSRLNSLVKSLFIALTSQVNLRLFPESTRHCPKQKQAAHRAACQFFPPRSPA
jgi:hypothetical protein